MLKPPVAILTGPTASGKSSLALRFAQAHGSVELINADSMLVYEGMDIGTAKPTSEERESIPHHLIDIRKPSEAFTAGDFVRATHDALQGIHRKGKRALIVGGTGFYLKALLYGIWDAPKTDPALRISLEKESSESLYRELFERDEQSALRIGINDRYRLVRAMEIIRLSGKTPSELQAQQPQTADPQFTLWVVDRETPELMERIRARIDQMLRDGMIDEVERVRKAFPDSRALSAVGYHEICQFLDGRRPAGRKVPAGMKGLTSEMELATRQLVKKQRTWFRGQKQAKWFILDRELPKLEQEFKELYPA